MSKRNNISGVKKLGVVKNHGLKQGEHMSETRTPLVNYRVINHETIRLLDKTCSK